MRCPTGASTATREHAPPTAWGDRAFRCNERTGTPFTFLAYPTASVLLVVRWRLQYTLSLRDLAQLFGERGFAFPHEAVRDWEARFAPLLTARLRAKPRGTAGKKWYVEET